MLPSGQPETHLLEVMQTVLRSVQRTEERFSAPSVNANDFMRAPANNGLYKVHTIPGKGRGLITARDIKAGEVILKDEPIILILPEKINKVLFLTLPRKALEAILLLHNAYPNLKKYSVQIDSPINRPLELLQGALDTKYFDTSKASCGRLGVLLLTGALFNDEDGANEERDWDDKEQRMVFSNACDVRTGDKLVADYCAKIVRKARAERLRAYDI
jgi:hypothetical protein